MTDATSSGNVTALVRHGGTWWRSVELWKADRTGIETDETRRLRVEREAEEAFKAKMRRLLTEGVRP